MTRNAKADEPYYDLHSSSAKQSLNGGWRFCQDPLGYGVENRYYEEENTTYAHWQLIGVPSTYNLDENRYYQGKVWYQKQLRLNQDQIADKQVILRCLGVALRCRIWINGQEVGKHYYGWIPFEMDVTPYVQEGKNSLVMLVDNEILEKGIPDEKWDGWWNYGGIFRDVYLDFRPACNIRTAYTETRMNGDDWTLTANADCFNITNESKPCTLKMRLYDNNNHLVWHDNRSTVLHSGVKEVSVETTLSDVQAWSPEHPVLYRLVCYLSHKDSHTFETTVAFRQIETKGSTLLLNAKPFRLLGTNFHEEYPGVGNALRPDIIDRTIENAVELNANFIRTGHYTHHPYFYEVCDRKGFLVWTEIPAWKTKLESLSDPATYERYGEGQLRAMVQQYRKYPCIVMWSVGNEFSSDHPIGRNYVEKACGFVKSLDPTRLVTFASSRHRGPAPDREIDKVSDLTYDIVDIIGLNEYYGWYYGKDEDIGPKLDQIHAMYPDKPIVITEVGAGAAPDGNIQRVKSDAKKDYSLDHQCYHHEQHLAQIYDPARSDYVAGAMIWVMADFHDPHRTRSTHPTAWLAVNLKGLTSLEREKKPAFDTVRDIYEKLQHEQ